MSGKVLKIASNDLYGNVDDRCVSVYACFEHSKYMNNYVVFSIEGNNNLCYGSVHIKNDSLVIFSVKKETEKYILEFLEEYMTNKLENFKILSINKMTKVEIVSYNEMKYDDVQLLCDKAIPKKIITEEKNVSNKKNTGLYLVLFILILFAIGITVLYLKPEWFTVKLKALDCTSRIYDNNMELYYDVSKDIRFDTDNKVSSIDVVRTYTFLDSNFYYQFKNSDNHYKYFNNGESYKYMDEELTLRVMYQEDMIIDDYDEMLTYMKKEGYSCIERQYEK